MRQKQHADALSAPKTRRPRGLAAAMGASGSRPDITPLASASQTNPSPAISSATESSSSVTQASEPPVSTSGNQDQSEADVPPHSNNSRSRISSSTNTSSSSNHVFTSDVWSTESSSSDHVSGKGSGSGSRKCVTMAQLGAVMLDQLGYSLEVRTSGDLSFMTAPLAIFTEARPIAWQRTYAVLSKTTTQATLNAGLTNSVGEIPFNVTALIKKQSAKVSAVLALDVN